MSATYQESLSWLFSRHRFGMTRTLDTTRKLLAHFGNPHLAIPCIHVAGTNGKGSTCAMLASVLQVNGERCGVYTSPHLVDWRERITVGRTLPDEALCAELIDAIRPLADQLNATFFEITTALAFQIFRSMNTTLNVIETGLGGTWDSTNLVQPVVAHLTRIDLDHTEILGKTRTLIAQDKSGIWKPGCVVTAASQTASVARLLEQRSVERKCARYFYAPNVIQVVRARNDSTQVRLKWKVDSKLNSISHVQLLLSGDHQLDNLAGAVTVLHGLCETGYSLRPSALEDGLAQVQWRGRWELIHHNPPVYADAAHNPAAAKALAEVVQQHIQHTNATVHIVFGLLRDKDLRGFLSEFSHSPVRIYAVGLTGERSRPAAEIVFESQSLQLSASEFSSALAAYQAAVTNCVNNDIILITGSHYLLGELLPVITSDLR